MNEDAGKHIQERTKKTLIATIDTIVHRYTDSVYPTVRKIINDSMSQFLDIEARVNDSDEEEDKDHKLGHGASALVVNS